MIGISSSTSITIATADAIGQLPALKNWLHNRRPIIRVSGPPSNSGMTISPTAGIITSMQPAMMPLRDIGKVILMKAFQGLAPRS